MRREAEILPANLHAALSTFASLYLSYLKTRLLCLRYALPSLGRSVCCVYGIKVLSLGVLSPADLLLEKNSSGTFVQECSESVGLLDFLGRSRGTSAILPWIGLGTSR